MGGYVSEKLRKSKRLDDLKRRVSSTQVQGPENLRLHFEMSFFFFF
jgi:hypothetical protein